MKINDVARMCHDLNRAYCIGLGDMSQPTWEDAPSWQKDSAVSGVEFHLDNPTAGPSGSHESWLRVKEAEGWKYGPIKDPEKKEHPCMVPYKELPRDQQTKDKLFVAVIDAVRYMVK